MDEARHRTRRPFTGAGTAAGTAIATLLTGLGLLAPSFARAADPASLRALISLRHPGVEWVTTEQLSEWLAQGEATAPLLLDARSSEEFAVSRIAGARRVDPDAKGEALPIVEPGRRIVVYCSVGYRSAAIARRLQAQGHADVQNLQGGLFAWANEGRPIVDAHGASTRFVHPYGGKWQRYLDAPLRSYDGTTPAR